LPMDDAPAAAPLLPKSRRKQPVPADFTRALPI
jgi:hypothetical protein